MKGGESAEESGVGETVLDTGQGRAARSSSQHLQLALDQRCKELP